MPQARWNYSHEPALNFLLPCHAFPTETPKRLWLRWPLTGLCPPALHCFPLWSLIACASLVSRTIVRNVKLFFEWH